jgi:dienelactone hydrolase
MQKVMGPMPAEDRKVPLDVQVYDEHKAQKYTRKTISFASEAGDRVPAFLLVPHEIKGRVPAMLCLHQTTAIGKQEPAGMGIKNLAYAAELAERGMVTLAPDYPGFGDYKIDAYAKGYVSATMKGIWNHRRAVDVLESLPEVDPGRIGAIGHSLGGHNSLFVAVFEPRIKAVVTSCGFNAFPKYFKGNLKGWSHKGYMPRIATEYGLDPKRMPFDFTEILGAIAPRALFINAPLKDANFEVTGVQDCVAAAAPVYELLGAKEALRPVYPDAAHDFPPEVRTQAYDFLEATFRRDVRRPLQDRFHARGPLGPHHVEISCLTR